MAVKFILGATGCGKTSYAFDQMFKRSHNEGSMELLIVPEQYTLQAQEEYIGYTKAKGLLGVEVLSFNRLVYRFFDELGLANRKTMNDNGKSLMIRKIIDKHIDEFTWIKKHRKKQSYMEELNTLITECYQYSITEEILEKYITQVDEQLLKDKLKDLKVLLNYFRTEILSEFMTSQEASLKLIELMPTIDGLKNATITLDSFYGFTPLQYKFIEALMKVVKDVNICLTIPGDENLSDLRNDSELFYESKKAISQIRDIIGELRLVEDEPVILAEMKRTKAKELVHLSKGLFKYPTLPFDGDNSHLRFMEALSVEDEVEAVALRIHKLIVNSGYRFKDIVVLTSKLESYENQVGTIFNQYKLTHFIDKKEGITTHPLIQFLLSALLVVQYNFKYEHVYYHLKSIYYKDQDLINRIENYALKYGIKGYNTWSKDWEEFQDEKELLMKPLFDLFADIKKAKTVEEKTRVFYAYLESVDVYSIHEQISGELEEEIKLQEANTYVKVYDLVIEMFDELVNLIGDETISIKDYVGLIETGVSGIKLGQTPPSVDQILVGDISRTRFKANKIVFILGVNEGRVPLIKNTNQLITDRERSKLMELGLEVAPNQSKSLFKEQMNIYMSFTKATKLLHISYTRRDQEGTQRPAPLFFSLRKMFPNVKVENATKIIRDDSSITRELPMFRRLSNLTLTRDFRDKETEISTLYNFFKKAYNEREGFVLNPEIFVSGLHYHNVPENIGKLEVKDYKLSVSELESYASCPYSHYLDYRLNLRERDEYVVTMPDIGILFHKCLELYIKKCVQRQIDISETSVELRNSLIEECIAEVLGDTRNKIFSSSYRNKYLVVKLTRILKRSLWGIEKQLSKSLFRPKEIEYQFDGKDNELDSLVLRIAPDANMFLKGVVDRVDEYESDDSMYISIIDYKSGNKNLEFGLIDGGVQLQLFVYLNVVKEIKEFNTSKKVIPSGLYYYQIQDPFVSSEEANSSVIESELLKQIRPKGLVLHDESVVRMFDEEIVGTSNVIPVTLSSKGISSKSSTITEDEMDVTLDYVNKKTIELGTNVYNGDLSINPYRYQTMTNCDYCQFSSVCRFDPGNKDETYREIKKDSKKNIIEKMKGDSNGRCH